jgi:Sigma-70, region 4
MASLDSLPPDQRAVLQMVLARGRGYDQIAEMLQIDRAGVRERALQALDALGPATNVGDSRRALITDYLLGQLPTQVSEETRQSLGRSPTERAWARVVAAELAPLASGDLPEIPSGEVPEQAPEPVAAAEEPDTPRIPPDYGLREPQPPRPPRSSRLGGAILLGVGALVVIGVVVFLIVNSGGSSKKSKSPATASTPSTTAATTTTSTKGCNPATSTTACPVHQINLISPAGRSTVGIAEVLRKGSTTAIAIVAQGVPSNTTHNAYAVWLYNSAADALRLGFVNPGVGKNGRLQTAGALPANASRYRQLLVTLESQANPRAPGQIVLEGPFAAG